ncbi:hypothetical protein QQZ08_012224 [Neonectria magnoliae]|uniref:Uncharacterized protein n=1 Tax=Neonectria magnoliae TaxID=2732573 RepID=A0ABR1H418_9HYPO
MMQILKFSPQKRVLESGFHTEIGLAGAEKWDGFGASESLNGRLPWAIPSNLIPAAQGFGGLLALRVLSGAFEAIADPAFMLITSMYFEHVH